MISGQIDTGRFRQLMARSARTQMLLVGNSHINCMVGASSIEPLSRINVRGSATFMAMQMPWPWNDQACQTAIAAARDTVLFISWHGNEHNNQFLLEIDPPFDFLSSRFPHLPIENAHLLSETAVRAAFAYSVDGLRKFIGDARAAGVATIAIIGGPPPKRNESFLKRLLLEGVENYVSAAERLGVAPQDLKFTAPFVRLKLWGVLQDMREELARSEGCHYIGPPSSAVDDDGFLKEEFWNYDLTHANFAYGDLALCEAISYCLEKMTPPIHE